MQTNPRSIYEPTMNTVSILKQAPAQLCLPYEATTFCEGLQMETWIDMEIMRPRVSFCWYLKSQFSPDTKWLGQC